MNLSKELLAKAKTAKTAEELMELAKAEKIELTAEQATAYFAKLNQATGEMADEELDNVAGGGCSGSNYTSDGRLIVDSHSKCANYREPHDHVSWGGMICANCVYAESRGGVYMCNSDLNRR